MTRSLFGEFTNRFIKCEIRRYTHNSKIDFKKFRERKEFNDILEELKEIFENQIFPYSKDMNYKFSRDIAVQHLENCVNMDLNDSQFCEMAKELNIPILTHDGDYSKTEDIEIITANLSLLQESKTV